jgi:hypothetical protein
MKRNIQPAQPPDPFDHARAAFADLEADLAGQAFAGVMGLDNNAEPFERVPSNPVIANMEVLQRHEPRNVAFPNPPLPPPPPQQPDNQQVDAMPIQDNEPIILGDARSREIIASIEADMLRQQQEESRAQANLQRVLSRIFSNEMVIGPYSSHLLTNSTFASRRRQNPNLMLSTMMMQQQHRNYAQPHSAINQMDDSSECSIESCISYDGKNTQIFAIHCQSQEQAYACQMLNMAVNDLVNAPVMPILREFPMLTRFMSVDDDSGDVALHYGKGIVCTLYFSCYFLIVSSDRRLAHFQLSEPTTVKQ